jgi:molecular chaperone GrpE
MGKQRRKIERRDAGGGSLSGQSSPSRPDSSERTAAATGDAPVEPSSRAHATDAAPSSPTTEEQQEQVEKDLGDLLADVERERDEYLELARRTKADFENYRKRVAGEAAEAERRGRAQLARELLPVLDNLDRAIAATEPLDKQSSPSRLAEGVHLVREELVGVLRRSGVESYEPTGERFDPHLHEAMMTRPTAEGDAGKVLEVIEKGYRLDGQVLRPARVVVGEAANERAEERTSSDKAEDDESEA